MLNRVWRFVVFPAALSAGIALAMWLVSPETEAAHDPLDPHADFDGDGCVDGIDLIFLGLRYNCCGPCTDTPGAICTPCADPSDPADPCADTKIGCKAPVGCPCDDTSDPLRTQCYSKVDPLGLTGAAYDIGPLVESVPDPDGKIDSSDLNVLSGEFGRQDPWCP